jgi:hypothetical protein
MPRRDSAMPRDKTAPLNYLMLPRGLMSASAHRLLMTDRRCRDIVAAFCHAAGAQPAMLFRPVTRQIPPRRDGASATATMLMPRTMTSARSRLMLYAMRVARAHAIEYARCHVASAARDAAVRCREFFAMPGVTRRHAQHSPLRCRYFV